MAWRALYAAGSHAEQLELDAGVQGVEEGVHVLALRRRKVGLQLVEGQRPLPVHFAKGVHQGQHTAAVETRFKNTVVQALA